MSRRTKLREVLNDAADGKLTVLRQAEELKLTRRAAQRAALVGAPKDELTALRKMEARAKGFFTQNMAKLVMRTGITPLEFLIREMRDVSNPKDLRIACAVQSLPYIHAKLPNEVKIDTNAQTVNFVNVQQTQLSQLSDEELDQLSALADKLRPAIDVTPERVEDEQ